MTAYERLFRTARRAVRRTGLGRLLLQRVIEPSQRLAALRYPDRRLNVTALGHQMMVLSPRRNPVGRALYRTGIWEPSVTSAIRQRVQQGMVAIDVGADIGYYTLLMARAVGPGGMVFAFEPIPQARSLLSQNISANFYDNVVISDCALANVHGEAVLEAPLERSRLALMKTQPEVSDLVVKLRRFDDLAGQLGVTRVDFVKIDVEGAEHEVLRGMQRTIRDWMPILIVEVHHAMLRLFNSSSRELMEWLVAAGYAVTPIDGVATPASDGTTTLCCEAVAVQSPS